MDLTTHIKALFWILKPQLAFEDEKMVTENERSSPNDDLYQDIWYYDYILITYKVS